ncbi:hypothetical protein BGX27_011024 [Mortierella sp. AM989]|nr:hypothetical protein BGX27_011024 [Mortierella sp. AM989]
MTNNPSLNSPTSSRHPQHQLVDSDHDDHDHDMDNENDMDNDVDPGNHSHSTGGSAPIRRKRLTQACDPCRKKKIKCDGNKPSCANCAKIEVQCTYLPSMKKRGPRQGYIELLEKRLDKMEKMLQNGPSVAIDQEPIDPPVSDGENDSNEPAFTRPNKPDSRYFGNTSAFSHYNDSEKLINLPAFCNSRQEPAKSLTKNKKPLYGIKGEVPRKDILDHLIQLFFDSVYFQLPMIHPGTFMTQYREGKVSPNLLNAICASAARFSTHPDVVTTPAFLAGEPFASNVRAALIDSIDIPTVANVQALLLLGMYEYGAARGPRAWMFGGMAIRMAHELGLNREDSSPVFYLKGDWVMRETRRRTFWGCFIMDVLASSSSGRPRMMDERDCEVLLPSEDIAWHEARPVVTEMLDGDDETDSSVESSKEEKPDINTNKTTSPRSENSHATADASEPSAKQKPNKSEGNQKSHRLSSFAYLIRILGILGKVSQYVNRPQTKKSIPPNEPGSEFSILDAALAAWLQSIPSAFKYSPSENSQMLGEKREGCLIIFMYVIYHTSVVLLHRPILAADKASFPMNPNFVETSVARCTEAASKVSEVLDFVTAQSFEPRVYVSSFFAYPVFTTATIHITNAFASDPILAAKARRNLSTHVKILQTMKSYWAMADKFFYIIRDLYSIQSKISSSAASGGIIVPQVVSHNPHGCSRNYQADGAVDALKSKEVARSRSNIEKDEEMTRQGLEGEPIVPRMVVEGKLASISSFLKSDSGLIALWRRASEMQVIDEANQQKRRVMATEEPTRTQQQITYRHQNSRELEENDLQEQRRRMDQLEIQEINQEFERQCKAKSLEEQQLLQNGSVKEQEKYGHEMLETQTAEKMFTEYDEHASLRASKLPRVTKATTSVGTAMSQSQTQKSFANSIGSEKSADVPSVSNITYRHSMLQQPEQFKQLQEQEAYILQRMLVQTDNAAAATTSSSSNINQHLMNVYSQQRQQQEALSHTMDLSQNANIQQQHQQLQQVPVSSPLAFGPSGGFSTTFPLSNSAVHQQHQPSHFQPNPQEQNQQSQQLDFFNGPKFGPPLVYGSSYSHTQSSTAQAELANSIFDFAMPLGDLNFLSSSFQMTPMMQQQQQQQNQQQSNGRSGSFGSMNNLVSDNSYNNDALSSASLSPIAQLSSSPQSQLQSVRPPSLTSDSGSSPSLTSPAPSTVSSASILVSSLDTPDLTSNSSIPQGHSSSDPLSPTTTVSTDKISPSLHSFMMSDDAFAEMQSTPDSLVRYLQLHHQQQIQQELQLQQRDMQPILNQQNSLIYDNYFQWSQLLPDSNGLVPLSLQQQHQQLQQQYHLQQQQHQPQQQQQQQKQPELQPISSMGMEMDGLLNGHGSIHTTFPSFS